MNHHDSRRRRDHTWVTWAYDTILKNDIVNYNQYCATSQKYVKDKNITGNTFLDQKTFKIDDFYKRNYVPAVDQSFTWWKKKKIKLLNLNKVRGGAHAFGTITMNDHFFELMGYHDEKMPNILYEPDRYVKVFHHRLKYIKKRLFSRKDSIFGDIDWHFWRIEFQHRGAPHLHFLIRLKNPERLKDGYTICATLPHPSEKVKSNTTLSQK